MKIRYKTSRQGPGITIKAGDEAEVNQEKGERLIIAGHADLVTEIKKPKVIKAVIDNSSTKSRKKKK